MGGVDYRQHWFVGRCWTAGTSDCNTANRTTGGAIEFYRVLVVVSWPQKHCSGGTCAFYTSTLVSPASDPVFAAPTPAQTSSGGTPTPTATPAPSSSPAQPPAIWADRRTAGGGPALSIDNATVTVNGLIHSNADLQILSSAVIATPGTEYVTSRTITGSVFTGPAPVAVAAATPTSRNALDYMPGGSAATAAGAKYYAVNAASCSGGKWTYTDSQVPATATIVYVPCSLVVTNSAVNVTALLVASGTISVDRSNATIGNATDPKSTGLISASAASPAISISGSSLRIYGRVQAVSGGVGVTATGTSIRCGIVGNTVSIQGNAIDISTDGGCA
jgi:hypothetical protein